MTPLEQLQWLRDHVLFSCVHCTAEYSWHASDLHVKPDGNLMCWNCADEAGEREEWSKWPQFDPFKVIEAALTEQEGIGQ